VRKKSEIRRNDATAKKQKANGAREARLLISDFPISSFVSDFGFRISDLLSRITHHVSRVTPVRRLPWHRPFLHVRLPRDRRVALGRHPEYRGVVRGGGFLHMRGCASTVFPGGAYDFGGAELQGVFREISHGGD
jgi:hypothetical protein